MASHDMEPGCSPDPCPNTSCLCYQRPAWHSASDSIIHRRRVLGSMHCAGSVSRQRAVLEELQCAAPMSVLMLYNQSSRASFRCSPQPTSARALRKASLLKFPLLLLLLLLVRLFPYHHIQIDRHTSSPQASPNCQQSVNALTCGRGNFYVLHGSRGPRRQRQGWASLAASSSEHYDRSQVLLHQERAWT